MTGLQHLYVFRELYETVQDTVTSEGTWERLWLPTTLQNSRDTDFKIHDTELGLFACTKEDL